MKRLCLPLVALFFATGFTGRAQAGADSDGLELLKKVARHYADAKSYQLMSVEERTNTNDYQHLWTKTVRIAAEAPGGLYYFEGHSNLGSGIRASDGKTVWQYRPDQLRYTAKPIATNDNPDPHKGAPGPIAMSEMATVEAQRLRQTLAELDQPFQSARRLADETISVDGRPVQCAVVRMRAGDQKRTTGDDTFEKTIWIDAAHDTVVRMAEHQHIHVLNFGGSMVDEQDTTTTFSQTGLDGPIEAARFVFTPPAEAHQIQEFPNPRESGFGESLAGDPIPALKFKSADGKTVAIESFRGKPVLLDFWATWCAPCLASMPKLAQLYKEAHDKGLELISVDQDEDAAKATQFLAEKGYAWRNFHDGDGSIQQQVGPHGIPRMILIDAAGQVVYDGAGDDEARLRTHVAALGPEFRSVAPRQQQPCVASK